MRELLEWFRYDFMFFSNLVFLAIFKKVDIEMLAEHSATTTDYKDWQTKQELKNAIHEGDISEIKRLINSDDVEFVFDKQIYENFLRTFHRYQIFYAFLLLALIFIVLYIGRRI